MALPVPANVTCDLYHNGGAPPLNPDVAGVAGYLQSDFERRNETGEGEGVNYRYTHVLLVDGAVDVRDGFNQWTMGTADSVFIPDKGGTRLVVRFVERRNKGTAAEHKRVYLDRGPVAWPSNNL